MRWRLPVDGDTRTRRRFAWLPVDARGTDDNDKPIATRVWLEWYDLHERFVADRLGGMWFKTKLTLFGGAAGRSET